MKDFLKLKKMITPIIIPILFWIGTIGCIIAGIVHIVMGIIGEMGMGMIGGGETVLNGFLLIFLGPIVVRVYCEFLIVLFSINDKLTDIKNVLEHQRDNENSSLDEKQ